MTAQTNRIATILNKTEYHLARQVCYPRRVGNNPTSSVRSVGRYAIHDEIASGGVGAVHLGKILGAAGFSRTVVIKKLHRHLAHNPAFVAMLCDEACLAAKIHHPNVVQPLDIVQDEGELLVVMEYIRGESLDTLIRQCAQKQVPISPSIAAAIVIDALAGLHAAHSATTEDNEPLLIVHRDVSPHNILVGIDGVSRIADFGIAKATTRNQLTEQGQIKGKLAYLAPEQIDGLALTPACDVFAAGIVLWELLAGRQLFATDTEAGTIFRVFNAPIDPPSSVSDVPPAVDEVVLCALQRDPAKRFRTAEDMALALRRALPVASPSEVGSFVSNIAYDSLKKKAVLVAAMERRSASSWRPASLLVPPPLVTSSDSDSRTYSAPADDPANTRPRAFENQPSLALLPGDIDSGPTSLGPKQQMSWRVGVIGSIIAILSLLVVIVVGLSTLGYETAERPALRAESHRDDSNDTRPGRRARIPEGRNAEVRRSPAFWIALLACAVAVAALVLLAYLARASSKASSLIVVAKNGKNLGQGNEKKVGTLSLPPPTGRSKLIRYGIPSLTILLGIAALTFVAFVVFLPFMRSKGYFRPERPERIHRGERGERGERRMHGQGDSPKPSASDDPADDETPLPE